MRGARRRNILLGCLVGAATGVWACSDSPVAPEAERPDAVRAAHPNELADFFTGGGRIDYPQRDGGVGDPEKNTPESHEFQTWGFVFGDKDGDGAVEGQLQHVDHRDSHRIDGKPRNYHSISWSAYEAREPMCEGGEGDGGAVARGTILRKNDGTEWFFVLRVDDCGEPGTKAPHDFYRLEVSDGYFVEGKLTGGNIQAHFRGRPR